MRRAIRFAVRIQPLHTRKTADTGRTTTFAATWKWVSSTALWIHPLTRRYAVRPAIQSRPLAVLRTLSGLSSQVCSNSRCVPRVKLSTATTISRSPSSVTSVSVPAAGENASLTASAPPPVRSQRSMIRVAASSLPTRGRMLPAMMVSGISAVSALEASATARSKPAMRWKRLTTRRTKAGRSQNVSVRRTRSRFIASDATALVGSAPDARSDRIPSRIRAGGPGHLRRHHRPGVHRRAGEAPAGVRRDGGLHPRDGARGGARGGLRRHHRHRDAHPRPGRARAQVAASRGNRARSPAGSASRRSSSCSPSRARSSRTRPSRSRSGPGSG